MAGGRIVCWTLLLLLLLPTLLLAQDDCSHNCKNEANRYYYVRPEGSAETLCPAQPCLTPSQLREHFFGCKHNNSCQTANTSLVLLPGTYTFDSNYGSLIPPLNFSSLTGYNEVCNTDSSATPSINCNGTSISLMFQHIKCLHVQNCVVFTGHDTDVAVDHVTFHDSLIRLASITAADHSELDYNYTLGSQSYCLLQKQLADVNALVPSNSVLALRNVSFSSDYHSECAREYGIQLTTLHACGNVLEIRDCLFTQNAITHISLFHSTLHTSGMVRFQNANTAIKVNSSTIDLAGTVFFINNKYSAIRSYGTILLAGIVEFTNNTGNKGGAVLVVGGNVTIGANAQVVFQGNHADTAGGAIASIQHVTIAGSVQFINNSADRGGAINSDSNVTITNMSQVVFQDNHAKIVGGAIVSGEYTSIAGSVHFINNSAYQGGGINSFGGVTIENNAEVVFQGNHADTAGGAIGSNEHVTIAGSVQFINNSASQGGAVIVVDGNITIVKDTQVVFQGNRADTAGGAISSIHHATIAGTAQFVNNSASQGGAIDSVGSLTIADIAQVVIQGNHADNAGGAIATGRDLTIAGTVNVIDNSAYNGGAISSAGNVMIVDTAQVVFHGNHAVNTGGAIASAHYVALAGTVEFSSNSALLDGGAVVSRALTVANNSQIVFQGNHANNNGGAALSYQDVTIAGMVEFTNNSANRYGGAVVVVGYYALAISKTAQVVFQGNHAKQFGGAIGSQYVTIAGSVQFINNSAYQGGAIEADVSLIITDNARVVFQDNHASTIGGAIFSFQHTTIAGAVELTNNSAMQGGAVTSIGGVSIANNSHVVVQGNHAEQIGGAIYSQGNVFIAGAVHLINNTGTLGGAIDCGANITISDAAQVIFHGNHAKDTGGALASAHHVTLAGTVEFSNNSALDGGAIQCIELTVADNAQILFHNNYADNQGGGITVVGDVRLAGSVHFINNSAQIGGAFAMFSGPMTIANNAEVLFQGNHAFRVGGAIFSGDYSLLYSTILGTDVCLISFGTNCTIDFNNNTAERGGSAMYGITVSKLECGSSSNSDYEYLFDILTIVPDSFSAVSSDPLRVCICPDQSTPDCLAILPDQNIPHLHYTVYPGQNFTIPAAAVGFNFALTSGSVYAQFLNSDASLGSKFQKVQGVNQTVCSQLQYSVLSSKSRETLVLTTNGRHVAGIYGNTEEVIRIQNSNFFIFLPDNLTNPSQYYENSTFITNLTDSVFHLAGYVVYPLQATPVFVSIHLLGCPPGFTLTGQHRCDCDKRILKNLLSCDINSQTVNRYGNIWVNASFSGNTSNGVIVHKHCPFEYCKPEQLDVNLTHPETQCAFDHYGTLCGACKPNFSLALGGSKCLSQCSNKYLLLLIVFVLAGFALVFFIKILNLTVSQGTINGLIFYANIVAANRSIFFPAQHDNFLSFLSVFISWLNLDLGIETCFIKGLDGYWKTWLQFAFPFYVWAIAGAIILASHVSTRATKIFGDKSVSVLATLFLLSYTKLLRSIIIIFSFTTLEYPDNTTAKVWSYDGNLQYLSAKHIPLFLFALLTLLLLWLPFTAVLLSAQWLRTQTHRKGLRWLKPFLDAYYGPFKDKHHYWVGVLLLVRGALFAIFSSFFAVENNVNILLISITSVSISTFTSITGRLYKKMYLTILEHSFFLNLAVLAFGTYHIRLVHGNQEALVTTSIGIAFLEFCAITTFHCYLFAIIPIRKWYVKVRANGRIVFENNVQLQPLLNSDSSSDDDSLEYMPRNINEVTHSEIRLSQLREEQDPPNPTTSAEHQLPPADRINSRHSDEILIPFNRDTPQSNIHPTKLPDAAANEAAGAPTQSEAVAVSLDQPPPPPQESSEPPRYFAAEREERFIDFNAPRETLLEYTQYRLPQERNEPARDSTAERELLNAPHEHPQESSEPRYFAAEREGPIDFTAPRESLLDYTQ